MLRKCSICNKEKELERFVKQTGKYRSDPYRKDCKDCKNYRRREKVKVEPKFWNRGTGKGRWSVNYHKWRNSVLERDKFTCQECGKNECLHCHHIIPWKDREDLRFDVNNGKTLCQACHIRLESKLRWEIGDSEETKKRKSESHKGKLAWNKGIPRTEKEKRNQSDKMKGKSSPWKGRKPSEETRKKMSESQKGKIPWNKGLKNHGPTNSEH